MRCYARFITELSASRVASPIRRITEIQQAAGPDMISFGTGAPNAKCFPFSKITVNTSFGDIQLEGASLSPALQYGPTQGLPAFHGWLLALQRRLHPTAHSDDLDVLVTPGSQDALSKVFDMTLNIGDHMFIEQPTYPGTLAGLRPYKPNFIQLTTDAHGLDPKSLESKMEDISESGGTKPKILYVQPNCSNPSGVSMTLDRRRQLLKIAHDHDLLVLEDDPYYFLRFDHNPLPSLLSLDTDARVLRFDSFSKIVSSGLRLGTVTGPKPLIERLLLHLQVSSMHASSLSQVIMNELVQRIGHDGFLEHARCVASFYSSQCDLMCVSADQHLKGLATWNTPDGGMFLWLKSTGVKDTRNMIENKAITQQVILAPGNLFFVDEHQPTPYMRASFSNVTKQQMDKGFQRLAELLRAEQQ